MTGDCTWRGRTNDSCDYPAILGSDRCARHTAAAEFDAYATKLLDLQPPEPGTFTRIPARELTPGATVYDDRRGRLTITHAFTDGARRWTSLAYTDGTGSVHNPDAEILVETPHV